MELLQGVVSGDESHFENNRDRLRVMAGNGKPIFLPFGLTYAIKRVLGLESKVSALTAVEFRESFRTSMDASSKNQLLNGQVNHPLSSKQFGFHKHLILSPMDQGRKHHVRLQNQARARSRPNQSIQEWAAESALENAGLELTDAQATKLGTALDAAYRYDMDLFHDARTGQYNFAKHEGDWVDQQQLNYLCDPRVHLLTTEIRIKERCGKSPQAERIILLTDLLKSYGILPFLGSGKGSSS
jgi:hypothetical protein